MKTVDMTQDAQKTHQDRDMRDRIDRLKTRVKEAKTSRDVLNAMLGILDLLADEL